jgi:ADP-ribose pyrophosphatase YjhB (NUDIX family)
MPTVCAFALILDDRSRLLLCRRKKDGKWNLPGGHVEPKEPPWETVVREVREEIGLDVRVERLLGVYSVPTENDLVLTFICSPSSATTHASDEIDQIDWFEPGRLPAGMRQRHDGRAKDAFNNNAVVMRVED